MIEQRAEASHSSKPAAAGPGAWIVGEPAMPDLLEDPVIHAVLRRDGLSLADLQRAIADARLRLAALRRTASSPASDAA